MRLLKNFFAISILLVAFIIPISLVPLVIAQEGEVTLNPTDDAYTDSSNPNSNYGGQNVLHVSKIEILEIYEEITWLKFNLSDVPDGAVVDVATLELYCSITFETYNVYAHSCSNNSWTELTLTYSNMPSFNATSMDSTAIPSSLEWYSWNVIDAIRKAVDGIHGGPDLVTIVLLETTVRGSGPGVSFDSNSSMLFPPKLTIHWSDIIPEFPTWTSIILILTVLSFAIVIHKRRLLKTPIHQTTCGAHFSPNIEDLRDRVFTATDKITR